MLIQFEHTFVTRAHSQVLQGVNTTLNQQRIGIVGPNGAGKSTFAKLLNGLVLPTSGKVTLDGLDTLRDLKAIRRQVGFVFQNPENQIVFPIVREDMAFGLKAHRLPAAESTQRIEHCLDSLGVGHLIDRASHSLSGGECQLVALASVLVMQPSLVVFDEPTTQLDLRNRNRVAAAIASLSQQVVVVTHDLDLLMDFDRVLVIAEGNIAADDIPSVALTWYREHCS